jgi:hypothetical protein
MIHRVNNCFGLTLFRSKRRNVELWACLSPVKAHTHPGQHSEIVPLFGWSRFYRVNEDGATEKVCINPLKWFRSFSIPAGCRHWFEGVPLVFLNVSTGSKSAGVNISFT